MVQWYHIAFKILFNIGSGNDLYHIWCQAIIWTKAGLLTIAVFFECKPQWNFNQTKMFLLRECIWNCCPKMNVGHFDYMPWICSERFQWILPHYMKPINFQSKASVACSFTTAVLIDFWLKKLNVFSQHVGQKTNEYQFLSVPYITAACTNTGGNMKGSFPRIADWCPFVPRHS